jgi:hypothetical protein
MSENAKLLNIPSADPFDPENLRLDQSFTEATGVKKLAYRADVAIIELEEERENYLVTPNTAADLQNELRVKTLFTAINRQGVVFLLPVPVAAADMRILEWHRSLREGAEMAMRRWVRVQANRNMGAYEISEATGAIPEPTWPDVPFRELLRIAFRDRFIDRLDHPVVRQLRGG